MLLTSPLKTIRTRRHLRSMRSTIARIGVTHDRWPRLRETEQIQRELHRLPQTKQAHF